jgi:hypothetical protein
VTVNVLGMALMLAGLAATLYALATQPTGAERNGS